MILHTASQVITGEISAGAGLQAGAGVVAGNLTDKLADNLTEKLGIENETAKNFVGNLVAGVGGYAAGGAAGASSAATVDRYNRQLHQAEIDLIKQNAELYAQLKACEQQTGEQCTNDQAQGYEVSGEEREKAQIELMKQAMFQTDTVWEGHFEDNSSAKDFLDDIVDKNDNPKLFYATEDEKKDHVQNLDVLSANLDEYVKMENEIDGFNLKWHELEDNIKFDGSADEEGFPPEYAGETGYKNEDGNPDQVLQQLQQYNDTLVGGIVMHQLNESGEQLTIKPEVHKGPSVPIGQTIINYNGEVPTAPIFEGVPLIVLGHEMGHTKFGGSYCDYSGQDPGCGTDYKDTNVQTHENPLRLYMNLQPGKHDLSKPLPPRPTYTETMGSDKGKRFWVLHGPTVPFPYSENDEYWGWGEYED